MGLPNQQTQPAKIKASEMATRALELRKSGAAFAQIAQAVGYADESGARGAVKRLLNKHETETVDEYRKLEIMRLDAAELAIASQIKAGNFGAIDRLIKIINERAKLLGLYAAEKRELSIKELNKLSDDELLAITES